MYPINTLISFIDRTNNKVYTSHFMSLYSSDSINRGVPGVMSGTPYFTNTNYGSSNYNYIPTTWPYTSNFNDITQKVTLKIGGGVTCCNSFSNLQLSDNRTGHAYTLLWTNTVANISIYRPPSFAIGLTIDMRILNVINPYPIQK